ncbi:MAG: hypothetical protein RIT43_1570 [Bacteroidota bacterium]|jgi:hypothetical protein
MEVTASITGLFKTFLIILGAIVLLRFLGQLMMAKRNMEEERKLNKQKREFEQERATKLRNFGKISILKSNRNNSGPFPEAEETDFEEIK